MERLEFLEKTRAILNKKQRTTKQPKSYYDLKGCRNRISIHQGGTRCWIGGTIVLTTDGYKPIEDININDTVYSMNGQVIETKRVVNKYIYKSVQTKHKLIKFVYNNQQLICTYGHKFRVKGAYIEAILIAQRAMENANGQIRSIKPRPYINIPQILFNKQNENGNNEAGKRYFRIPENCNVQPNSKSTSGCSQSMGRKSKQKATSKPQERNQNRQQGREFRVGYSQGEHKTRCKKRFSGQSERGGQWKLKVHNRASKTSKGKPKNGSQRVIRNDRRFRFNNKRHQGWTDLATHLIQSVEFIESDETIYDIEVEDNNNYLVTTENIVSHNSGKTYSILQGLCEFCYENQDGGMIISIVRKTLPSLRQTAMRDFLEILHDNSWYRVKDHNKTENTYNLFGNTVEFFGVDQAQKVRGSKRHILYINEANELTWDEWFQLNIRTKLKAIIDFNPSMEEMHWIYKRLLIRNDVGYYTSTYKDNPFLSKLEVREIEMLKETDDHYWTIFGMGLRAKNPALVFQYKPTTLIPQNAKFIAYGLDFGFSNDPTALVGVYRRGNEVYLQERIYDKQMTNDDLSLRMHEVGIKQYDKIIADNADPKSIKDLKKKGWKVLPAKKGKDSISFTIDILKRYKLFVTDSSPNIAREFNLYKYKQYSDGTLSNTPVDAFNHAIDATRYVAEHGLGSIGKYLLH